MTTHVNVLQNMIISGFRPSTRGPSLLIMGIGLSFYMNPKLAFVFVVCTPILAIILFLIVRKVAPMGDPIEIHLRGYELTIRVDDAKDIEIERVAD